MNKSLQHTVYVGFKSLGIASSISFFTLSVKSQCQRTPTALNLKLFDHIKTKYMRPKTSCISNARLDEKRCLQGQWMHASIRPSFHICCTRLFWSRTLSPWTWSLRQPRGSEKSSISIDKWLRTVMGSESSFSDRCEGVRIRGYSTRHIGLREFVANRVKVVKKWLLFLLGPLLLLQLQLLFFSQILFRHLFLLQLALGWEYLWALFKEWYWFYLPTVEIF